MVNATNSFELVPQEPKRKRGAKEGKLPGKQKLLRRTLLCGQAERVRSRVAVCGPQAAEPQQGQGTGGAAACLRRQRRFSGAMSKPPDCFA